MNRLLAQAGILRVDRLLVPFRPGRLRPDAPLLLQMADGSEIRVMFRVDSGCTHSLMPLDRAASLGLPTMGTRTRINLHTTVASGRTEAVRVACRFRLHAAQEAAPFVLPLILLPGMSIERTPLLGLDILEHLRWVFDGRPLTNAPHGHCLLEDARTASRRFPG